MATTSVARCRAGPGRPGALEVAVLAAPGLRARPAVLAGAGQRRQQAVPVPRPGRLPAPARRTCGIPGRPPAACPTSTSATSGPMGPWFWALERLGVPDWVAQRLWLGTLALAGRPRRPLAPRAGSGWAGPAALVGALVYLLTPYQLAFTARIVGAPAAVGRRCRGCVGLTDRAERDGGWRDPALIALVVLTIGGGERVVAGAGRRRAAACGSLAVDHEPGRGRAAAAARRPGGSPCSASGCRCGGSSALRLQARLRAAGAPGHREPRDGRRAPRRRATCSAGSATGSSTGRTASATRSTRPSTTSTTSPRWSSPSPSPPSASAAGIVVRWRHRARFVAARAGRARWWRSGPGRSTIPSPFAHGGRPSSPTPRPGWPCGTPPAPRRSSCSASPACSARPSARAARPRRSDGAPPALVGAAGARRAAAGVVDGPALGAPASGRIRSRPTGSRRPPRSTRAAHDTRVLELPGSNFAAYRWGNAVDPILPGLMERGRAGARGAARRARPARCCSSTPSTGGSRRARSSRQPSRRSRGCFGVGDVVLRSDLEYERFRTPQPACPVAPAHRAGRARARRAGRPTARRRRTGRPGPARWSTRSSCGRRATHADPPPVAVLPGARARRRSCGSPRPTEPIVLSGDGDGIVDAAAAGLVDGRSLVLQSHVPQRRCARRRPRRRAATWCVTDTYRRRIQTWFYAIRDTRGPTEQAGETLDEPSGYDYRIDPTPDVGDDDRTVVEQVGGHVTATAGGGADRPEDRAASAVDGDVRTAWRVGGEDPTGAARCALDGPDGVTADHLTLVQPQDGPRDRVLTEVRLRVDGGRPIDVTLTEDVAGGRPGRSSRFPETAGARGRARAHRACPPRRSTRPSPTRSASPRCASATSSWRSGSGCRPVSSSAGRRRRWPPLDLVLTPPPLRAREPWPAGPGAGAASGVRPPGGRGRSGWPAPLRVEPERSGRGARRAARHRRSTGPS